MIVKLKCVDNGGNSYLTSGKVYDGIIDSDETFAIVDDEGDLIINSMTRELHGKWEVVEE